MPSRRRAQGNRSRKGEATEEKIVHHDEDRSSRTRKRGETIASKLRKRVSSESHAEDAKSAKKSKVSDALQSNRTQESLDAMRTLAQNPREFLMCNFGARTRPPQICSSHILTSLQHSLNFVHYLYGASLGKASCQNKKSLLSPVVRELEDLRLFRTASPFDRRTTAVEWHPTQPNILAAGSKGGDIILWDTMTQNINNHFIQGIGPGGSIQAMKFWPWNSDMILTASIDGQVVLRDFEGKHNRILSDTFDCYSYWYCCVDVNACKKVVVTGDNKGETLLLALDGRKLWSHRLHQQKVTHAEFSPREPWLLCTASTDQTVKMWDIRKVSGRKSALHVLKHDKPVNSAYFSRTDGCRLLTTDQHSQLRVYCGPEWVLGNTIAHPHRFFQHLTPIKASWHPLQDLIVVGRYPDKEFPSFYEGELRTIDIIDAVSGDIVSQLHDPQAPGIVSLNKFNERGDFLASGMGVNLLVWGRSQDVEERQQSLLASGSNSGPDSLLSSSRSASSSRRGSQRNRDPPSKQTKSKKGHSEKVKIKLQAQTKTKTKNTR